MESSSFHISLAQGHSRSPRLSQTAKAYLGTVEKIRGQQHEPKNYQLPLGIRCFPFGLSYSRVVGAWQELAACQASSMQQRSSEKIGLKGPTTSIHRKYTGMFSVVIKNPSRKGSSSCLAENTGDASYAACPASSALPPRIH